MLMQTVCAQLEKTINAYLSICEDVELNKLDDNLIHIQLSAIDINFYFHFVEQKVRVTSQYDSKPTVAIKATPLAFVRLMAEDARTLAANKDITIEGDVSKAQLMQQVFQQANINWPQYLALLVGDTGTHIVEETIEHGRDFLKQFATSMRLNTTEYLQEEVNVLPPAEMLEDFYHDIDDLVLDVERLKLRVERLESATKNKGTNE